MATATASEISINPLKRCHQCGELIRPGEPAWTERARVDHAALPLSLTLDRQPPPPPRTWHCRCLGAPGRRLDHAPPLTPCLRGGVAPAERRRETPPFSGAAATQP